MTLRLGNKKVCPTKLVKVNNVDFSKLNYQNYYTTTSSGGPLLINGYYTRFNSPLVVNNGGIEYSASSGVVDFSQPFEINCEFIAPTTAGGAIFGNNYPNQYYRCPTAEFQADGTNTIWTAVSTDGSTWTNVFVFTPGEVPSVLGGRYIINHKYDGSNYTVSVTYDGNTVTKTQVLSTPPYFSGNASATGSYFGFGGTANAGRLQFKDGKIWIGNTYIKQDGVLTWGCEEGQVLNKYPQANIIKNGALLERKEIVLDNFSNANYGYKSIPSFGNNPWEFECEFTAGDLTTDQEIIGISTRGASPFYLVSNTLSLFLSSNGTSWDIASGSNYLTLSSGVTYHMKAEYTGTQYKVSRYLNGTWNTLQTVSSSTPINQDGNLWIGINQRGTSPNRPFKGSINLSKCSLKVNGETVWQGTTEVIE